MAYRLPSERVEVPVTEGLVIEVERLVPGPLYRAALRLLAGVFAEQPASDASERLYRLFVPLAQPTFAIIDTLGVVPPTVEGIGRLPDAVGLQMVMGWLETATPQTTAADELLPEGPLRDAMNDGLREARKRRMKAA